MATASRCVRRNVQIPVFADMQPENSENQEPTESATEKKSKKIDNGLIPNAKNLAPMKIIFANLFIHSKFVDEMKPVQ